MKIIPGQVELATIHFDISLLFECLGMVNTASFYSGYYIIKWKKKILDLDILKTETVLMITVTTDMSTTDKTLEVEEKGKLEEGNNYQVLLQKRKLNFLIFYKNDTDNFAFFWILNSKWNQFSLF